MGYPWEFDCKRLRMENVRIEAGTIGIESNSTDCALENVIAPNVSTLNFQAGSTGVYRNVTPDPGPISGSTTDQVLVLPKVAEPAAPPGNGAAIYVRDNGSGKNQLCVRFPTGSVQILATEP
jgi:hypothetical protein